MLTLPPDAYTYIKWGLSRHIAVCPVTGAYLNFTNGKGKGMLNKYHLFTPDGTKIKTVRAYTDGEAIRAANDILDRATFGWYRSELNAIMAGVI